MTILVTGGDGQLATCLKKKSLKSQKKELLLTILS